MANATLQITNEKPQHIPIRQCVVCRQKKPQAELIRFAKDKEDMWHLDIRGRLTGRGAWLCEAKTEQNKNTCPCHKRKKLQRFFKGQTNHIHDELTAWFEFHHKNST